MTPGRPQSHPPARTTMRDAQGRRPLASVPKQASASDMRARSSRRSRASIRPPEGRMGQRRSGGGRSRLLRRTALSFLSPLRARSSYGRPTAFATARRRIPPVASSRIWPCAGDLARDASTPTIPLQKEARHLFKGALTSCFATQGALPLGRSGRRSPGEWASALGDLSLQHEADFAGERAERRRLGSLSRRRSSDQRTRRDHA